MDFKFDNESPIYVQLVEQLRIGIVSLKFVSGERLPSVRELALMAKVNPNTMQKALMELEDEKLIYTERTNGKFVTKDTKLIKRIREKLAKDKVQTFFLDMEKIGMSEDAVIEYLQEVTKKEDIWN